MSVTRSVMGLVCKGKQQGSTVQSPAHAMEAALSVRPTNRNRAAADQGKYYITCALRQQQIKYEFH